MSEIQTFGIEFIRFLQSMQSDIGGIMDFLALLVRAELMFVFLIPLLAWNGSLRFIAALFALLMIDMMLGDALKVLFAQPRPWWIARDLMPLDYVTSVYSSPGGYSSMMTVICGYLYLNLRKTWLIPVGLITILLTSISKMYHASLMPDHMLLGFIQGILVLTVYWYTKERVTAWFDNSSLTTWGLTIVGVVAVGNLFMYLCFMIHDTYQIPIQYIEFKMLAHMRFAQGGITIATGFLLGSMFAYKKAMISGQATLSELPLKLRVLPSIIGVIVIFSLMGIIRGTLSDAVDSSLITWFITVVFSTITGYWIFYGLNTWYRRFV